LHEGIKHLFAFTNLTSNRRRINKRQLESISWKSFYNIIVKRKGILMGEQRRI